MLGRRKGRGVGGDTHEVGVEVIHLLLQHWRLDVWIRHPHHHHAPADTTHLATWNTRQCCGAWDTARRHEANDLTKTNTKTNGTLEHPHVFMFNTPGKATHHTSTKIITWQFRTPQHWQLKRPCTGTSNTPDNECMWIYIIKVCNICMHYIIMFKTWLNFKDRWKC